MSRNEHRSSPPGTKKEGHHADETEGRDDSLINSSPADRRSDEKVVVNEQSSNKIVNGPSQTGADTSEGSSNEEEIMD